MHRLEKHEQASVYFLTQVLLALSHFMSFAFLQSAFVVGASAALATIGAEKATRTPVRNAPRTSLEIIWISPPSSFLDVVQVCARYSSEPDGVLTAHILFRKVGASASENNFSAIVFARISKKQNFAKDT